MCFLLLSLSNAENYRTQLFKGIIIFFYLKQIVGFGLFLREKQWKKTTVFSMKKTKTIAAGKMAGHVQRHLHKSTGKEIWCFFTKTQL